MIKQITVDVEYCDHCKENVADKTCSEIIIKCDYCGKSLCKECKSYVYGSYVCPDCRQERFKRYFELINEMDELDKRYELLKKESEEELNKALAVNKK